MLKKYFCALMRAHLTARELAEINARNARAEYAGACASHEFCDANALMFGAFCAAHFREPSPECESDSAAMNAAWNAARAAGFDLERVKDDT